MNLVKKEKEIVVAEIVLLFILPVLLLYFDIISDNFRVIMLLLVTLMLFGIVKNENWSFSDIGIKKRFMEDIIPYSLFTIGSVLFVLWLGRVVPHEPFVEWWESSRFILLFIPISVLQEIIFRGVLMNLLVRAFNSPIFIITLNAVVFAFMHVIYLNSMFVLPFTFIAGLGFAWMYYKYKNLVLISISHTILNFIAVAMGFFIIR
jgi:membrane protease YdiL (CAAX protease family)